MAVFCAFWHKFRNALIVSVLCVVSVFGGANAYMMYPSCPDGKFSLEGLLDNYHSGVCRACPIGSYDKTDNHYGEEEKGDCRLCSAGMITENVGTTTLDENTGLDIVPCVACPNAVGAKTWESVNFIRVAMDDLESPRGVCGNSGEASPACNMGRVAGLCQISECKAGYTFGSNLCDLNGTASYAVTKDTSDPWGGVTSICHKRGNSLPSNNDTIDLCNSSGWFNGMNYNDWKTDNSTNKTVVGLICTSGTFSGTSLCSSSSGTLYTKGNPSNNSGKYCWCKATGFIPNSGDYNGTLFTVAFNNGSYDSSWVLGVSGNTYNNATACQDDCAIQCAEAARTSSAFRSVAFTDSDSNPVFDTVCNANTYSIDYILNGGTHGASHPSTATYDDLPFNVSNPTRVGYTFAGWTISGLYGGVNYGNNNPNSVYHYWGNSVSVNTFTASNSTQNLDASKTYFKNLRTTSGTVTFEARWTANQYTIAYDLDDNNDASLGTDHPTTATFDTVFHVDHPTRPGYVFGGWTIGPFEFGVPHWLGNSSDNLTLVPSQVQGVSGRFETYFTNLRATPGTVTFKATWSQCTGCNQGTGCTCNLSVVNNTCTYTTGAESGWTLVSGPDTATPVCSPTATYHPGNCHYNSNLTYVVNDIVVGSNYNVNMTSTVTNQLVDTDHRAFNGWATTPGGQVIYPVSVGGTVNSVSGPLNFYGDCDNIITLEWDWTSGVFDEEENMCTYGESGGIDVPALVSAPTGYIFGGWKVVRHQCYEEYPNCTPMP